MISASPEHLGECGDVLVNSIPNLFKSFPMTSSFFTLSECTLFIYSCELWCNQALSSMIRSITSILLICILTQVYLSRAVAMVNTYIFSYSSNWYGSAFIHVDCNVATAFQQFSNDRFIRIHALNAGSTMVSTPFHVIFHHTTIVVYHARYKSLTRLSQLLVGCFLRIFLNIILWTSLLHIGRNNWPDFTVLSTF